MVFAQQQQGKRERGGETTSEAGREVQFKEAQKLAEDPQTLSSLSQNPSHDTWPDRGPWEEFRSCFVYSVGPPVSTC